MIKSILCCLLVFATLDLVSAQTLSWTEALKQDPLSVKALDCSGLKWDSIPQQLLLYRNLEYLDLSKNKIQTLPDDFMHLEALKKLNLDRNDITKIPEQISNLQLLQSLDLYANAIEDFGEGLFSLSNLKVLNLEGVMYGTVFAKSFVAKLPHTKVLMDPPCKCLD